MSSGRKAAYGSRGRNKHMSLWRLPSMETQSTWCMTICCARRTLVFAAMSCSQCLWIGILWASSEFFAKKRSKRLNLPRCWTAWLMTRVMLSIIQLERWKYNKGVGRWQPGIRMVWRCKIAAELVTCHVEGPVKGRCDCHVEPAFYSSQERLESGR